MHVLIKLHRKKKEAIKYIIAYRFFLLSLFIYFFLLLLLLF